jgi:hypothetical protein
MTIRLACAVVILAAMTVAEEAAPPAAHFQILTYMTGQDQPAGLAEIEPGLFSAFGGSAYPRILTVTSKGDITVAAKMPGGHHVSGLPVVGPDGRVYNSLSPDNTMFSVGKADGTKFLPKQDVLPVLTEALPDGDFLGIAGTHERRWNLVKATTKGEITKLYEFPAGANLTASAFLASDGNYYGNYSMRDGSVAVYRVTPQGEMKEIWHSPPSVVIGGHRWIPLFQSSDGNLYGAMPNGGEARKGTIFRLTLAGEYMQVYEFPKPDDPKEDDYVPTALIEASDGNLYGATMGAGGSSLLFRVTKKGDYKLLREMAAYYDGSCQCHLVQGSDGIIYGSVANGGLSGTGAFFMLDAGLPRPAPRALAFSPAAGKPGTKVLIWGSNLLGSSVNFGGVPAALVSSSGAHYVWATVPAHAKSGAIIVTTAGGKSMTTASFRIS